MPPIPDRDEIERRAFDLNYRDPIVEALANGAAEIEHNAFIQSMAETVPETVPELSEDPSKK